MASVVGTAIHKSFAPAPNNRAQQQQFRTANYIQCVCVWLWIVIYRLMRWKSHQISSVKAATDRNSFKIPRKRRPIFRKMYKLNLLFFSVAQNWLPFQWGHFVCEANEFANDMEATMLYEYQFQSERNSIPTRRSCVLGSAIERVYPFPWQDWPVYAEMSSISINHVVLWGAVLFHNPHGLKQVSLICFKHRWRILWGKSTGLRCRHRIDFIRKMHHNCYAYKMHKEWI